MSGHLDTKARREGIENRREEMHQMSHTGSVWMAAYSMFVGSQSSVRVLFPAVFSDSDSECFL